MRTAAEIVAESEALIKLMNDPNFYAPELQMMIARVINELAWLNDDAPPVSKILVDGRQTMNTTPEQKV
jgi:hypothetical protein